MKYLIMLCCTFRLMGEAAFSVQQQLRLPQPQREGDLAIYWLALHMATIAMVRADKARTLSKKKKDYGIIDRCATATEIKKGIFCVQLGLSHNLERKPTDLGCQLPSRERPRKFLS